MSEDPTGQSLPIDWPVGPQFVELDPREGVYAWVAFKLKSADWYLARLEQLVAVLPRVEHQVGVEMALDGVLASLCSAVDAACAGVIEAADAKLLRPKPTPEHKYTPELAAQRLRECGRKKAPAALVAARVGHDKPGPPSGWVAQLGRLRNKVVHSTALGRIHYVGGERDGDVHIDIPGLGPEYPVIYLRKARAKVDRLCTQLLKEVAWLAPSQTVGQPSQSVNLTVPTAARVTVNAHEANQDSSKP